jgi:nucleotide-binding universal stress UspA family protein
MHKKILHGLDGSEGSFKALVEAIDLSKRYGAELHTISVEEIPRMPETVGEMIEEKNTANGFFKDAVEKAGQMAAAQGMELRPHVFLGHEVHMIVEYVKQHGFDLLVIGFIGHSAIHERVMGSTCQSLVRLVPCTVLVVK